jgi:hypothetical protein
MIRTIKLYGTTDGSGDLTVTADVAVVGLLHSVEWIVGNFAAGVDAVLSLDRDDNAADITLLTLTAADADKVYHTRYLASNNVGADLDTAGDATYTKGFVSGKLKLVVSDGGDKKTGGCIVYVEA